MRNCRLPFPTFTMIAALEIVCLLTLLAYYATAQLPLATCQPGFDWSFNDLGQSPCSIASSLIAPCDGGTPFPVPPLDQDINHTYGGPIAGKDVICTCNTVVYSLLSACAICQNHHILQWTTFSANCTKVVVGGYTTPIPAGVDIPHYAYLDVTATNLFNVSLAETAGGPEVSGPSLPTSATTGAGSGAKHSDVGAIAGGVVGGVVGLAIVIGLCSYFVVQRKKKKNTLAGPFFDEPLEPPVVTPPTPVESYNVSQIPHQYAPLKYYDPSDPSTFPPPPSSQRHTAYSLPQV